MSVTGLDGIRCDCLAGHCGSDRLPKVLTPTISTTCDWGETFIEAEFDCNTPPILLIVHLVPPPWSNLDTEMLRLHHPFRGSRRVRAFSVAEAHERGITTTSAEMNFLYAVACSLATCQTHVSKKRDIGTLSVLFRRGLPASTIRPNEVS